MHACTHTRKCAYMHSVQAYTSHMRIHISHVHAGILSDLFPGVALPELDYDVIRAALTQNAIKMNLQPLPTFLDKAIQLYEMIIIRHGLMLVRVSHGQPQ